MTIALLLGSFNPPHIAHIALAEYVLQHHLANEVWLVVSPQNPMKSTLELAPYTHRVAMTRLAAMHNSKFKVETIEESLPKPSYTYNTIRELQKKYPQHQFVILAGSDIGAQINQWYRAEKLSQMVRFLYYPRENGDKLCCPELADAPLMDVSSTQIRKMIGIGQFINLSPVVVKYITDYNLYKPMKTITELDMLIKENPSSDNYFQRGKLHYAHNNFGMAINDFAQSLVIDPHHTAAREMLEITRSIMDFRNFDIYNP